MNWTPIPDQKTREEYISKVMDMYKDKPLTVEQANYEAERLYHYDQDQWLDDCKE